ncbi:ssDNA-binding protein [Escherichia phage OLB145]|uniref:SsDNA-binding protein n=1 Tax=Escherichia phage OLB145 TaxID=2448910 RepID=A0A3G3MD48_9CAUD|nr:ssDNA-binding protein [Escherichia phage OLB145]
MSNLFGNLAGQAAKAEKATDNLGGGFGAKESDIYLANLKVAYVGKAASGANFIQIIADLTDLDGHSAGEYREQLYITSGTEKGCKCTYEKNGKEYFLPGYTVINDILVMTSGETIPEAVFEEKVVNVYDFDEKKEVAKSVMVPVNAIGGKFAVAILKSEEDKQTKDGSGNYVSTGETRFTNTIEKVFHPDLHLTVVEAEELTERGKELTVEEAVFWDKWLEKNKGVTRDKTTKGGASGKAGQPPKPGATNTGAGASAAKSLFGKK